MLATLMWTVQWLLLLPLGYGAIQQIQLAGANNFMAEPATAVPHPMDIGTACKIGSILLICEFVQLYFSNKR